MRQYFSSLLSAALLTFIFGTRYYWHLLMWYLAWGLVLIMGFWVAFNIFLYLKLEKHPNPNLRQFGQVWGKIWGYTAIFQATVIITLLYYIFGSVYIDENQALASFDWEYGMSYSSWIVYGIGFMPVFWVERRYLLGLLVFAASWGVVGAFFFAEDKMREMATQYSFLFMSGLLILQLAMSALSMHLVIGGGGRKG